VPAAELNSKLCPQVKGQAADFPVCQSEDFQIVPSVDGRHQDFEEFRLEIRRVVFRVFFLELCPIAAQVLQGVNLLSFRSMNCMVCTSFVI
jgi:hypothetical protein